MELLTGSVWSKITALAKAAQRREVAVAYLGKGATKQLPLDAGDVLVVDMSLASLRAGRTHPGEIAAYLKRGVEVFSVENLHAKVFVFDETVVIGSPNASNHSKDVLVEAAVLTRSRATCRAARSFIRELCLAPLTPELVEAAAKQYRSPKWQSGKRSRGRADVGRVWVTNTHPMDNSEEEETILETQAERASRKLRSASEYEVETVRYSVRSRFATKAKPGDVVIVIHRDGATIDVYPPARVLRTERYRYDGISRIGVHLERRVEEEVWYWSAFKRAAKEAGVRLSKNSEREILNDAARLAILRFFRE